jgi:Carboxypeptidase regulatory-like domain/TonB-dependent Receptor Plug Domain
MTKKAFVFSAGFLSLFLFATMTLGQNITASISGTVTDPSGAVVPGATVAVHNNDTNTDVRTVQSDSTGVYAVPLLPVGNYRVTVKAPGFKDWAANDVVLHVGDHLALDAQLQPGQVTQEITVTTSAVPVQTRSAAQSTTITGTQIRELQLNNRNFEQLLLLQPGVASGLPDQISFGITNTDAISVNGNRTSANNWTVDGSDVNDSGSNLTLLNVPSVDALAEFKLERSTYDAQYGRSGGGQVNVITRSGTSQFHGSAYEFFRNDVLNANTFFLNSANKPKQPFRYNDFGYTFGGPFYIPGHYNTDKTKTFFFWSEEWRRTRIPSTSIATLPTTDQLNGTFAGTQLNPDSAPTGCISNDAVNNVGQISPSCFSPNAVAYINNIYSKFSPNGPANEFITPLSAINNYRQEVLRIDQRITDKVQVFGRAIQDNVPTTEPGGLFAGNPLPGISSTSTNAPGRNFVAHVTMQLTPSVVNEVAFNYSWGAINSAITGSIIDPAFVGAIDTSAFPFSDPYHRVPGISISGITGVAIPVSPYHERNIDKQVYDNLSIVHGSHSIRVGFSSQWMRKSENAVNPTNGSFSFRSAGGNPAFANFLLGDASTFSQSSRDIIPDLHFVNIGVYVQDDWKIRPNLTLNLGLRYSYLPTPHDNNKILDNFSPAVFDPSAVPQIDPTTGNFVAGQAVTPANYANGIIVNQNGCDPSLYFATPVPGFGPTCSPYGNDVNPNYNTTFEPRIGFAWDPFRDGKTSVRGGYGIYYDRTLNGIWEQNSFANPPYVGTASASNTFAPALDLFDNPSQGLATPLFPVSLHVTGSPAFKVPYSQNWSLSVQREVLPNTLVEVAYVGNKGTHLLGEFDFNQVPLSVRTANPTVVANAIRPYVGYNVISTIAPQFNSNYNSLQVSLNRRVSQGLNLGIAYTWSKTLTNNSTDRSTAVYDSYNFANEYGPASFSQSQIFVMNYVYDLPFYRAQQGLMGHVLGGWEVSGITSFNTGFPLTVTQFNDPFNSFDYAAGTPNVYPDGIGIDPSPVSPRPDRVSGQAVTGPKTVAQYFNTAAFTDAIGHFGGSGRGVVVGPGLNNWDISAIKNIKLSERFSTQFRAEFFNAFNHTSFSSVNTATDSSSYGRVTATHDPRIIQLALKLYF